MNPTMPAQLQSIPLGGPGMIPAAPPQTAPNSPTIMDFLRAVTLVPRQAAQGIADLGALGGYAVNKYLLNDPTADATFARIPSNPGGFLTPQENTQESQSIRQDPIGSTGRLAAGLGSYLVSPETLGLSGLGGGLASGAVSGGLQGLSQPGATPASIATNAGFGALLSNLFPAISNTVGNKITEGTLGPGGKMLPQIEEAIGQPIQGSMAYIRDNIGSLTKPTLEGEFQQLLSSPTKSMTLDEFQNMLKSPEVWQKAGLSAPTSDPFRWTAQTPEIQAVRDVLNSSRDRAATYLKNENGMDPMDVLNYINGDNAKMPLEYWNQVLHQDIGNRVPWGQNNMTSDQNLMKQLYGELQNNIKGSIQDPQRFEQLNQMKQAAAQIKNYLTQQAAPQSPNSGRFWQQALIPSALIGLMSGHLGGYGGVAAAMEGQKLFTNTPQVALPIARTLQDGGAGNTLLRLLGIGASQPATQAYLSNNQ